MPRDIWLAVDPQYLRALSGEMLALVFTNK